MSQLLKRQALEEKINAFIKEIRLESDEIDDKFSFYSEEDEEIRAQFMINHEGNPMFRFYGGFSLHEGEIIKFLEFVDNSKKEYFLFLNENITQASP